MASDKNIHNTADIEALLRQLPNRCLDCWLAQIQTVLGFAQQREFERIPFQSSVPATDPKDQLTG